MAAAAAAAVGDGGRRTASSLEVLWRDLPEELRDEIAAHIPLPRLFALRLVCKHWSSLVSCPRFLHICSQISQQRPWLLVPRWPSYLGCLAYNPDSALWLNIPLAYLPLNLHLESANAGLLLMRTPEYSFPQRLYLCNPLRRSWSRIQCPSFVRGTAVLIERLCSNGKKSFRILALTRDTGPSMGLLAISYDSVSGSWVDGGRMPRNVRMGGSSRRSWLDSSGRFMLVLAERSERQVLFSYEIDKEKWAEVPLPEGSLDVSNWLVQCCNGNVFLVQLHPFSRKICIWRLDVVKKKWDCEAEHVPQEHMDRFVAEGDKRPNLDDCTDLGSRIVLCKLPNFLCYDLETKSWKWLPVLGEKSDFAHRAFCYTPLLSTLV